MSVDLKKFGADIKNACKEVTGDKNETNWALFGYEGQTNVLKLVSTGEFIDLKIMFYDFLSSNR